MRKGNIRFRHLANLSWHTEDRYWSISLYIAGIMFSFSITKADDNAMEIPE